MTDARGECRLLALSAELRNRIYRFVLMKTIAIRPQVEGDLEEEHNSLTLLPVCRQIRAEATGIYYSENTFRFYDTDKDDDGSEAAGWKSQLEYHNGEVYLESCITKMDVKILAICQHLSIQGVIDAPEAPGPDIDCMRDLSWNCAIRLEIDFKQRTVVASTKTVCCNVAIDYLIIRDQNAILDDPIDSLKNKIHGILVAELDDLGLNGLGLLMVQYMQHVFWSYQSPITGGSNTWDSS